MKKQTFLVFILCLTFTLNTYACTCSSLETTSNKYQQSDFVGIIKIIKIYKNEVDSIDRYKIDVKTTTLLKGKSVDKLTTEGFNEVPYRYSSCEVGFEVGKSYFVYGQNVNKETTVNYCGVDRYFNDETLKKLNLIKKYVSHFKVNTRWGQTTYIPYQLYLKYQPDSVNHLSLIKIDINKKIGSVKILHLSNDDKHLRKRLKKVLSELNWLSKLSDDFYPHEKYTFILEFYPYTSSKYLMEEMKSSPR